MENKKYEKNPLELGVIWEKTNAKGNKWFSGILEINGEKINIVIFASNGKSEKAPTHVILKSKPKEEVDNSQNPMSPLDKHFQNPVKVEVKNNEDGLPQIDIDEDISPESLPF